MLPPLWHARPDPMEWGQKRKKYTIFPPLGPWFHVSLERAPAGAWKVIVQINAFLVGEFNTFWKNN